MAVCMCLYRFLSEVASCKQTPFLKLYNHVNVKRCRVDFAKCFISFWDPNLFQGFSCLEKGVSWPWPHFSVQTGPRAPGRDVWRHLRGRGMGHVYSCTPSSTWDVTDLENLYIFPGGWNYLKSFTDLAWILWTQKHLGMLGAMAGVMLEKLWWLLGMQGHASRRDTRASVPSPQPSKCWVKKWAQTTPQEVSPERCFGAAWWLAVVGSSPLPIPLCPPAGWLFLKDRNPSSWTC